MISIETSKKASPSTAVARLSFVEGLRGIAAFVVMVGHGIAFILAGAYYDDTDFSSASLLRRLIWPFLYGTQMVWLFIFISGFSLYYSEIRRRSQQTSSTLTQYAWRRAWRILPTYYAALLISLLMIRFLPGMHVQPESSIFHLTPVTMGAVLSHVFLVHNLNLDWISQLNAPLWSIATEAQLYLIFPLILACMHRFNPYVMGTVIIIAQQLLQAIIPIPFFAQTFFFVSGMMMAHFVLHAPRMAPAPLLTAATALLGVATWYGPKHYGLPGQTLFLLCFVALILGLWNLKPSRWNLTTWTPILKLGACSYSLYVLHYPLLFLLFSFIKERGWSPDFQVLFMLIVGSTISVVAAWVFYLTIERWSLERVRQAPVSMIR